MPISTINDLTGQNFGYWRVLKRDETYPKGKHTKWICRCKCGTVKSVFSGSLTSGRSKSCGCVTYHNLGVNSTHGMSKSRIYHEWTSMRRRCSTTKGNDAKNYSGRGIRVCDEWEHDFLSFYSWAISHGYNDSLTIDRIDNNMGYSPDNCRWVSIERQQANKSNTVYVVYKGQRWCLRTLCNDIGFSYKLAHRRYRAMKKKNIPIDTDILFCPPGTKHHLYVGQK